VREGRGGAETYYCLGPVGIHREGSRDGGEEGKKCSLSYYAKARERVGKLQKVLKRQKKKKKENFGGTGA